MYDTCDTIDTCDTFDSWVYPWGRLCSLIWFAYCDTKPFENRAKENQAGTHARKLCYLDIG